MLLKGGVWMKKGALIIIGIIIISILMIVGKYNSLIVLQEAVNEKWAQVENVYQRRLDLIPNLVAIVKGYAEHEKEALTEVIEARAKALQTNIDMSSINDEAKFNAFAKAQDNLSSMLSRLMVVVERYPDLKANQNFLALQSQLEGTENRVSVERKRYNEAVRGYNTVIGRFPMKMIASMFGFEKVIYFKATPEAAIAPKIEF